MGVDAMGVDNGQGRSKRSKVQIGAAIGTVAALVGIVTGVLTLTNQLFSGDGGKGSTGGGESQPRKIPRYAGIAGHLAKGRALLDFLDQNNRQPVYLEVGFPDLATGPAGGDNVVSRTEPFEGGTRYLVSDVDLMTKCDANIRPENVNPTPADGCMGTELRIAGPETNDSQTFFEHGVPEFKGYFAVDVTGDLHQGLTAINLKPLTFEQARRR